MRLWGHRWGTHLPYQGLWVRRWIDHWVHDTCPVRWQTYGYFPSCGASPPFDRYQIILLGEQKHTCMNNLPWVVTWQCTSPELIQRPFCHQSDMLPSHTKNKRAQKKQNWCHWWKPVCQFSVEKVKVVQLYADGRITCWQWGEIVRVIKAHCFHIYCSYILRH